MANFDLAYQLVARAEGGYQNLPNDSGNYNTAGQLVGTNWGINAKVYGEYLGYPPSEQEMRSMSAATARLIYRRVFWARVKGDQIRDQNIANILFDGHVNQGFNGIRFMQRALGVPVDGVIGNITLTAINTANQRTLFYDYKQRRINDYHRLAREVPSMRSWLPIWLNRMADFEYDENFSQPPGIINPGANQATTWIAGGILLLFLLSKK